MIDVPALATRPGPIETADKDTRTHRNYRILGFLFKMLGASFKKKVLSSKLFFDPDWYRDNYLDIKRSGLNPYRHYVDHGFAEGRAPNGWADARLGVIRQGPTSLDDIRLQEQLKVVAESGLFDAKWYHQTYGVEEAKALRHFLTDGIAKATDPNPFFSSKVYNAQNPDVVSVSCNALFHYLDTGFLEKRPGHLQPRFADRIDLDEKAWLSGVENARSAG